MEVRDIFRLRREGHIEEAYAAIRPMYAAHKGRYTTLAMFQVGGDVLRLRLKADRLDEAYAIFRALVRMYPTVDDPELQSLQRLMRLAAELSLRVAAFSLPDFLTLYPLTRLPGEAWLTKNLNGKEVPGAALRVVSALYAGLKRDASIDKALRIAADLLPLILDKAPAYAPAQALRALCYELAEMEDPQKKPTKLRPSWE